MKHRLHSWFWLLAAVAVITLVIIWPQHNARAQEERFTRFRYAFPSVGIIRGEMLRVSVANPGEIPPGPCRILLFDPQGNIIGDSGRILLPAVQTQFQDFSWEKLTGDSTNGAAPGRIQVRAVVIVAHDNAVPPGPCRPGVELIQEDTGHTFGIQPAPDAERL